MSERSTRARVVEAAACAALLVAADLSCSWLLGRSLIFRPLLLVLERLTGTR